LNERVRVNLALFLFICKMKYNAIILDLGGVLIDIDYQKTIDAFIQLGMVDFKSIYSQASQQKLFNDYETGQISSQYFINQLLPFLKQGTSPNKVVEAWNAMILNVPLKKIELLEKLKLHYPLFLLSNTNELHVPVVRKEWAKVTDKPMESFFNTIYFSHELQQRKPNADIFKNVCERENLDPETTLFIDDSIQHIEGASSIGLQTYHLKNSADLYQFFS
jgi:FMN phosphatase YigB (HAD superfamily)